MEKLYGTWVDNTFVTEGAELMTVLPDGTLEIRGPGWGPRRSKKHHEGCDDLRTCKIGNVESARNIAELIAEIQYAPKA